MLCVVLGATIAIFETIPRYCPWCGEDLTDKRLRTEADYWRDCNEYDMDIYADMPVCELFDKSADLIDPQSS